MVDNPVPETLHFTATDGWMLEGDFHHASNPRIAVMISAGTGFPRTFYHPIARYLAGRGATVMTYDYRGIGGSNTSKSGFYDIDYPDWGHLDMPAALDTLIASAPGLPVTHLAHSVGGHFIGLMPNQAQIARHAFVSVGTGYFARHHISNIPRELLFWWIVGPYLIHRYGFVKAAGGWQGEGLPPLLFKTWRRWCHTKSYFKPDFANTPAAKGYDAVSAPIRSWIFPDDPIATPSTARDLLACYPSAKSETVLRSPSNIGVNRIGHEGAFRKGREVLWAEIGDWLVAAG